MTNEVSADISIESREGGRLVCAVLVVFVVHRGECRPNLSTRPPHGKLRIIGQPLIVEEKKEGKSSERRCSRV